MKAFRRLLLPMLLIVSTAISLAEEYTINVDLTFDTKYVFRGTQLADDIFHPSVEFAQGDFYAGIWAALPIENRGHRKSGRTKSIFTSAKNGLLAKRPAWISGLLITMFLKGKARPNHLLG